MVGLCTVYPTFVLLYGALRDNIMVEHSSFGGQILCVKQKKKNNSPIWFLSFSFFLFLRARERHFVFLLFLCFMQERVFSPVLRVFPLTREGTRGVTVPYALWKALSMAVRR